MGNSLAIINAMRADHAKAVADWHAAHPGEEPPSRFSIGEWFSDYIFRGTPRIGDWFCNVYASETNPQRIGMFVRRSSATFELTNCRGDFWKLLADSFVSIETPANAPLVRREPTE